MSVYLQKIRCLWGSEGGRVLTTEKCRWRSSWHSDHSEALSVGSALSLGIASQGHFPGWAWQPHHFRIQVPTSISGVNLMLSGFYTCLQEMEKSKSWRICDNWPVFYLIYRAAQDGDPPAVCEISPLVSYFGEVRNLRRYSFLYGIESCQWVIPYYIPCISLYRRSSYNFSIVHSNNTSSALINELIH